MKHQRPPQPHEEIPIAFPLATPINASFAEAMGKGASLLGRSFATLQKEGLRFMNQRLEENLKAVESFGACRSLPDLFAAQQRWFADMTRAYTTEWQRYGELMSEMASEEAASAELGRSRQPHTEHTH